MEVFEAILKRRSVREFLDKEVEKEKILKILEAGRWAPSGLNNQPWKFFVLKNQEMKKELAKLTKYGYIIENAPLNILVFLDLKESYDRTKDIMAIGAAIQNMLLEAVELGLGAVWLGEILKNKEKVNSLLNLHSELELMAVISIGYPKAEPEMSDRKPLEEIVTWV